MRRRFYRLRMRAFRAVSSWSLTIDGTVTWWSPDDNHFRERKLDHELRIRRGFRPFCWLLGHEEYYGYCAYCEKIRRQGETRGWRPY